MAITKFESMTFEDATRVIYFIFHGDPRSFLRVMEDLLDHPDEPNRYVARGWFDQYREYINQNKKEK